MNQFKKSKLFQSPIFTIPLFLIPYLLMMYSKELNIPIFIPIISYFVLNAILIIVKKIYTDISDEGNKFDIENIDDMYFKLIYRNKSIDVFYEDFNITNVKVYRHEINLFTKDIKLRIKPKMNNVNNIKLILENIGLEIYKTKFKQELNGIKFKE